jgi:hypothetical protein
VTALRWFTAYRDAVEMSHLLMTRQHAQAEQLYSSALATYTAAKGMEYADEVAGQVSALLAGVDALRRETT